jgi:PST family polysaccharide transporter
VVLVAQVASQFVSLAVLAILMRYVPPADYGLVGMILPAVMLPRMAATLGLATAVMQRDLSHRELSGLFWLNTTWGLVAAATTAVCGLLLAKAFDQPLLAPLALALAGSTILVAVANQHQALLERKFQLGPLAGIRLFAQVCGGIAGIYSARRGAGVWALVAQQYGELVVLAIWVWLLEPWRPGWPARGSSLAPLASFSRSYSASQLVNYAAQNLDKVFLPLFFGQAADRAVGLYSQAFNLMLKPVYLVTSPLTGVMVAGLSQARGDKEMHSALAARLFRLVGIGLFPCAVGLLLVAPDLMVVLGGPRWRPAGWILAALAPALLVQGLVNISGHVLASAGKAGRLLAGMTLLLALLVPACLAGFHLGRTYLAGFGSDPAIGASIGMAVFYSVVTLIWGPLYLVFSLRSADLSPWAVLRPLVPALVAALAMGLVVFGVQSLPAIGQIAPLWRLGVLLAAGVAAYALFACREIAWCWHELVAIRSAGDARPAA